MNNILQERELEMPLEFKGHDVGGRRVDSFIKEVLILEIKDIEHLEGLHKAQDINYCESYNWDNLFLACQRCNEREKLELFSLAAGSPRAINHLDSIGDERPSMDPKSPFSSMIGENVKKGIL
ncbi:GxxExxY protein [Fulvivirga maritima]|nr:GxxExxY protein [Fulvivirga maritima]UII25892.1 GxxExxY protein [Fulvivirga maritima]